MTINKLKTLGFDTEMRTFFCNDDILEVEENYENGMWNLKFEEEIIASSKNPFTFNGNGDFYTEDDYGFQHYFRYNGDKTWTDVLKDKKATAFYDYAYGSRLPGGNNSPYWDEIVYSTENEKSIKIRIRPDLHITQDEIIKDHCKCISRN